MLHLSRILQDFTPIIRSCIQAPECSNNTSWLPLLTGGSQNGALLGIYRFLNFWSGKQAGPSWGTGTPHPLDEECGLTDCHTALLSVASGARCHNSSTAWIAKIQVPARAPAVTLLSRPWIGKREFVAKWKLVCADEGSYWYPCTSQGQ